MRAYVGVDLSRVAAAHAAKLPQAARGDPCYSPTPSCMEDGELPGRRYQNERQAVSEIEQPHHPGYAHNESIGTCIGLRTRNIQRSRGSRLHNNEVCTVNLIRHQKRCVSRP